MAKASAKAKPAASSQTESPPAVPLSKQAIDWNQYPQYQPSIAFLTGKGMSKKEAHKYMEKQVRAELQKDEAQQSRAEEVGTRGKVSKLAGRINLGSPSKEREPS